MTNKQPEQDGNYIYFFSYEGTDNSIQLSNPILDEKVIITYRKFGEEKTVEITIQEIIDISYARKDVKTGEILEFN